MGIFSKIGGVKPRGKFDYLSFGHYLVRIEAVKEVESPRTKQSLVFVECTILSVLSNDPPAEHKPGQLVSWSLDPSAKFDYFARDFNGFVLGVTGDVDLSTFDKVEAADFAEKQVLGEQILSGLFAEVQAVPKRPRNNADNPPKDREIVYTSVFWRRPWSAGEVLEQVTGDIEKGTLSSDQYDSLFPQDILTKLVEAEMAEQEKSSQ